MHQSHNNNPAKRQNIKVWADISLFFGGRQGAFHKSILPKQAPVEIRLAFEEAGGVEGFVEAE